jgi:hypothetical protein
MPKARLTHCSGVPDSLSHPYAKHSPVNIDKFHSPGRSSVPFPTLRRIRWQAGALFATLVVSVVAVLLCTVSPVANADDWLPISPEELKMTSEPKAPGAPAIYLYRQP